MSTTTIYSSPASPGIAPGIAALQHALLWSIGAGGAVVFIEPSPYELATLGAMIIFFATGLRMRLAFLPLIILLFLMNIGYTICSAYILDQKEILNWILTSWYLTVTVVFFAMVFSEDAENRLDLLKRGLIFGALIASLAGIAGYFRLVPGGYDLLTLYGRARGTFKDPNVLGAFLVLPALFLLQAVVTERIGKAFRSAMILGIVVLALLLSFSRAAWGQFAATGAFMIGMMFLTSGSKEQRQRIVVMTIVAGAVLALAIAVLLSLDSIANLFKERASFNQGYDGGRFGRFGRHVLGAEMALDLPWGIGPLQFTKYFPEDTHNSYLNAFMSGGWIAGVCYPALIFSTVITGFKYLFKPTPWQKTYIAIFAAFLGTVGESFIIDTDHWRHFWLMLGAVWGMFVATHIHTRLQVRPAYVAVPQAA